MSTEPITPTVAPRETAPPAAASMPAGTAEQSALERSTGATTLGQMILRAGDRDGAALRYREGVAGTTRLRPVRAKGPVTWPEG